MAVANAIVETFPTLAAKMKASHISPAVSSLTILCLANHNLYTITVVYY